MDATNQSVMPSPTEEDQPLQNYVHLIRALATGNFDITIHPENNEALKDLQAAMVDLVAALRARKLENEKLNQITMQVNSGLLLEDILEMIYKNFKELVPFNRIGFSLVENEGKTVRAVWAKSDRPVIGLKKDYSAELEGSSLKKSSQPASRAF